MHNNLKAISLSHTNSSVDIRELFALEEASAKNFLNKLKEIGGVSEVVAISTCNRTEVYYSSEEDMFETIVKILGLEKGVESPMQYSEYFVNITNHDEAINKLFRVSMGLESQVVGDLQIINQVKNAYQWCADEDLAGPFLHRLMHTIFFTNKRVVQETPFRDGAASMSYAAVELIEELSENISAPKIALVGLGEIGIDTAKHLSESSFGEVTIYNRTEEKSKEVAEEFNFNYKPLDDISQIIEEADIIISSVATTSPIITANLLNKEVLTYKYFIDLSVPRSIDAEIENIPGVILYNIDKIQSKVNQALETRINAIADVEKIIEESIDEFSEWSKDMEVSPTINKLKNTLEEIRQQELTRYLKELSESEREKVEEITKNMMQKIIKLPVLNLKAACKRGEAETLIDVLNDLFDLEKKPVDNE